MSKMAATKMVTLLCTCLWLMLGCKAATVTTSYDLNVMTDMAELSTISATEEQIAKAACDKDSKQPLHTDASSCLQKLLRS